MSLFHGQIETHTIKVGGKTIRQEKFYCCVHGWFDLVVFENSERDHAACRHAPETQSGAAFELPKTLKKAA